MMTQVQTAQQPPQSGVTAELYAQVEDYLSRTEAQESQPTKKKRKVIKKKSAKPPRASRKEFLPDSSRSKSTARPSELRLMRLSAEW